MNRNTESHFALTPTAEVGRSKFERGFDHKTTFNNGDLIPIYCADILPGDTVKMRMSEVVRMMTPITPVMDNCYMDTYFFFIPNRLIWDHFKQFMGENDTAPWTQTNVYQIPQIQAPAAGWKKGSLADYFGYPTEVGGYEASALPFRCYVKCYNDWFRDQNLKNPLYMSTGDTTIVGTDKTTLGASYDPVVDTEKAAAPVKAAKFHDYFTSCLPQAQKGTAVSVPLGDAAPVIYDKSDTTVAGYMDLPTSLQGQNANYLNNSGGNVPVDENGVNIYTTAGGNVSYKLITDLSTAVGATVNELRMSFQIQRFFEKDALYGTRYIESVRAHFGVTNPDFRVQRSEYLGGKRVPININSLYGNQQTTAGLVPTYTDPDNPSPATLTWETANGAPQGTPGAYSCTADTDGDLFTKSFSEHGWLLGLAVCRCDHTYQQGINRMYLRKDKFDFYFPEFQNLGNQPVYKKEIYLDGTSTDEEAFGYQEAWADYRFQPSMITGEMRSNYAQSLDIWHYGDDYSTRPSLSSDWIDEPRENLDRTLAVQSQDQFFGDFYFSPIWTRPMPLYSIPGLIDHH